MDFSSILFRDNILYFVNKEVDFCLLYTQVVAMTSVISVVIVLIVVVIIDIVVLLLTCLSNHTFDKCTCLY